MSNETFVQPSLQDLAARFVAGQTGAHAGGLAAFDPGDVTPYDAGPVQPIDPKVAWQEALTALAHYGAEDSGKAAPPHWPQLVAQHEPVVALALCVGNFPQLARNFHQILQTADLAALRPSAGRPTMAPQLIAWANEVAAKRPFPAALNALAALRLAKQFDEADRLVAAVDDAVPENFRAGWDNEKAALAWHRGDADAALTIWKQLPTTLPVRFNLAMAELFAGGAPAAVAPLRELVHELPETSPWHHLARLYLTLALNR